MDAFLFYIDDWISSRKVEEMDQLEELAYFRLLLYAAKEDDCGLPKDPRRLARWSRLGAQWDMLTKDPEFQYDNKTSGQKILDCFPIEVNGRIYNERALKVFSKYKSAKEQKKAAANKRWGHSANASNVHPQCGDHADAYAGASSFGYAGSDAAVASSHDVSQCGKDAIRVENGYELESTKNKELLLDSTKPERRTGVIEFPTSGGNALAAIPRLNPYDIFEQIWQAYPEQGRSRKVISRGVFFGVLAQFEGKESELLTTILAGIAVWRDSDLWTRGAVHHIKNWLSERLWIETPPPAAVNRSSGTKRSAAIFRGRDEPIDKSVCQHCADTGRIFKPEVLADIKNPKWAAVPEPDLYTPCPHCQRKENRQ
jgi:hypothetical protein